MTEIVWTEFALKNIQAIRLYISQFNPGAARILADQLLAAGNNLANFPHRGRLVQKTNLRELLTVPPYIIRYKIDRGVIIILRVRHGARRTTKR